MNYWMDNGWILMLFFRGRLRRQGWEWGLPASEQMGLRFQPVSMVRRWLPKAVWEMLWRDRLECKFIIFGHDFFHVCNSDSVNCVDKNEEGMCLPQFRWGCSRFPWFLEDCQKLCGQCWILELIWLMWNINVHIFYRISRLRQQQIAPSSLETGTVNRIEIS